MRNIILFVDLGGLSTYVMMIMQKKKHLHFTTTGRLMILLLSGVAVASFSSCGMSSYMGAYSEAKDKYTLIQQLKNERLKNSSGRSPNDSNTPTTTSENYY